MSYLRDESKEDFVVVFLESYSAGLKKFEFSMTNFIGPVLNVINEFLWVSRHFLIGTLLLIEINIRISKNKSQNWEFLEALFK